MSSQIKLIRLCVESLLMLYDHKLDFICKLAIRKINYVKSTTRKSRKHVDKRDFEMCINVSPLPLSNYTNVINLLTTKPHKSGSKCS